MHQISRPLGLILSELLGDRLFLFGVVIKLVLILLLLPKIQQEWFVPFVVSWIENPITLPWTGYLLNGGDVLAFPYGIVMFISHLPTTALGWLIDNSFGLDYFSSFGFRISLLCADILLLMILLKTFENCWSGIMKYYWLSPLLLFITYWHGQTDIIPIALFFYAITLIKRKHFKLAGLMLACSISAKHSMIIAVPFIFLYLWSQNGNHRELGRFLLVFVFVSVLIEAPLFFTDAFQTMVLENKEVDKLYWLYINMSNGNTIYLTLVAYLLLLYFFWRIKRVNFDLLFAVLGVAFSVVILMTPSPPGWYLWLIPIFAIHQSRYGSGAVFLIGIFSLIFITYHLMLTSGASIILFDIDLFSGLIIQSQKNQSIHYTLMVGFGLLIAIQLLRTGVRENDYYRLGFRPLTLGIAGDSGAGKSTFSRSLALIFGDKSVAEVSGDDYHNWDRLSPMWQSFTHLDPKSNRLFQMVKDVRSLIDGKVVHARSYDHKTGRFQPARIKKSRNVILVEGLHALYPKQLLEEMDVRIFIEMDNSLRLFLRTNRDIKDRGHNEKSVKIDSDRRMLDSKRYIEPQSERADVVFSLLPINSELLMQFEPIEANIKIRARIKDGIYYHDLIRVLIGVCGLQVNIESTNEIGEVTLEIAGDIMAEDVALSINMLVPHIDEMLDLNAKFSGGFQGVMQIITIMEIDGALKRRRKL